MSFNDLEIRPDTLINKGDGLKYWNDLSPDVDSMLGGLSCVDKADLQNSRTFLAKLGIGKQSGRRTVINTLEGGAGIGRITEGLLLGISENVDVIEPVAKFTAALQNKLGVRHVFNVGLEDWEPVDDVQYDLIWTQWCVGHLTDEQLVAYLERCKATLKPDGGFIVIKENLSTSGSDAFDPVDSSVTREESKFRILFKQAGLKITKTELQRGLPAQIADKLLPVRCWALKPE